MRASRAIATLGYVGLLRPAPGTWGSAAALPAGYALHVAGGFPLLVLGTLVALGLGWWAARAEERATGAHDPGEIVIDEAVGIWIALMPLSGGLWHAGADPWVFPWPGWVGAFVLFRLFDIWKPGPVGWADRQPGAAGVMLDDVIAGLMAALGVAAAAFVAHGVLGA
ncbi:phosphatidylglycerophosphatase A [Meridianimarinicoccus roseus]|jgi:phosphatidylglycerophosphatase A|uniref:Phosphatidylglycerophosphatase A n=1 Tax=Meridianimarinicoccus roseus TaxID=2072018 RepID=A0A2V2LJ48_9RHOB|nr:phosphatidylglycerophosphatase A [Meridianimarinicoccus roseus]PWR04071.1 phosphatidylglycerophosphatase A [Meridianimarinicoccus roseus]